MSLHLNHFFLAVVLFGLLRNSWWCYQRISLGTLHTRSSYTFPVFSASKSELIFLALCKSLVTIMRLIFFGTFDDQFIGFFRFRFTLETYCPSFSSRLVSKNFVRLYSTVNLISGWYALSFGGWTSSVLSFFLLKTSSTNFVKRIGDSVRLHPFPTSSWLSLTELWIMDFPLSNHQFVWLVICSRRTSNPMSVFSITFSWSILIILASAYCWRRYISSRLNFIVSSIHVFGVSSSIL